MNSVVRPTLFSIKMIVEWKPTKRQEDFYRVPDNVFEVLYGGAAGGGKTDALLMLPLVKSDKLGKPLYQHHKFKLLYLRRTFPELDAEVIPRSKDYYPKAGFFPYHEQKKRWTHESGAIVQFGHCEHEKDVFKYDTAEYNIICYDEVTSFLPYQYEYLTFSRCRSSHSDLPAYVRAGTNPGNIAHSYFRKRFVEPYRAGNAILRETRPRTGTVLRIYIPAKIADNQYLLKNDPDYINRINRMPEAERAAKADGDWWTFSGQVFDDFRIEPFPDEPANAKHSISPFRIPDYWPRILSVDWGYSAYTAAGWYAINPCPNAKYPAQIYKYREYSCKKTKISFWASDIARISQGENIADAVLDPSAWGHRGDEKTIAEQIVEASGIKFRKADNDRISGKLLLQENLRWTPRPPRYVPLEDFDPEKYLAIERLRGPVAAESYASLFKSEEPESLLPKLQIFDSCEKTIETIPLCVYDKDRAEDVAEFDGDDFYDETRYGVNACQYHLEGGRAEHDELEERSKICSRLEQGGSVTQFYINMDNLESKQRKSGVCVRRYHRGRRFSHANW